MSGMVRRLQKQNDLSGDALLKLQESVRQMAQEIYEHELDYTNLKERLADSMFTISYIMGRLMMGNRILKQTSRMWKEKKLNAEFMDFFNFSMPCGDKCPINLATPISCAMNNEEDQIHIQFEAPHLNDTVHVLKSDSFELMARSSRNKTCSIKYTGPKTAIYSEKENCIYPLHSRYVSSNDLFLIPNRGCRSEKRLPNSTNFYSAESCVERQPKDEEDFIQIKHYDNANYIYCPESRIKIMEKIRPCPNQPFQIPLNTAFELNDFLYTADKMYVEYKAHSDPIMSFRANWDLQPTIRLNEIVAGIDKSEVLLNQSRQLRVPEVVNGHQTSILTIILSILLIACLLIIILLIYYFYKKNDGSSIRITARAVAPLEMDEIRAAVSN